MTRVQSNVVGFQYSYDAAGNRIAVTEMVNGVINHLEWTYDDANRLCEYLPPTSVGIMILQGEFDAAIVMGKVHHGFSFWIQSQAKS